MVRSSSLFIRSALPSLPQLPLLLFSPMSPAPGPLGRRLHVKAGADEDAARDLTTCRACDEAASERSWEARDARETDG